jgi:hypothetical protein
LVRRVSERGACPISLPAVVDDTGSNRHGRTCAVLCQLPRMRQSQLYAFNSPHLSLAYTSTPSFLVVPTISAAFDIQPPVSGTTTPLAALSHIHRDTAKHRVQTRGLRWSVECQCQWQARLSPLSLRIPVIPLRDIPRRRCRRIHLRYHLAQHVSRLKASPGASSESSCVLHLSSRSAPAPTDAVSVLQLQPGLFVHRSRPQEGVHHTQLRSVRQGPFEE